MTPNVIRGIRAHLDISQTVLSENTGIPIATLNRIEKGGVLKEDNRRALFDFFTENKIVISPSGKGYEEVDQTIQRLSGRNGLHTIYKQMYRSIRLGRSDLWLYNGISHLVADGLGTDFIKEHQAIMGSLDGKFNWRVVVEHGDDAFWGNQYAYYKWMDKSNFIDNNYTTKINLIAFLLR